MTSTDKQELARLRRENADLKEAAKPKPLTCKVSQKGAVSVYGLGRFPTTLYKEQWGRVLDAADTIREFIASNDAHLATKS